VAKILKLICPIFFVCFCTFYTQAREGQSSKDVSWEGNFYNKNSRLQDEFAAHALRERVFRSDESVLDVGCGTGKITSQIATLIPEGEVVGIDISKSMLGTARVLHGNVPNLSFRFADARDFVLDKQFDLIVSFFAVHWIDKQLETFKCMHNVLMPGGDLIITVGDGRSIIDSFFNSVEKRDDFFSVATKNFRTFMYQKPEEEFIDMLESAGFENITSKFVGRICHFDSFNELVGYFMGWLPQCIKLPEAQSLEVCRKMTEYMYNHNDLPLDGPIDFVLDFLELTASKSKL